MRRKGRTTVSSGYSHLDNAVNPLKCMITVTLLNFEHSNVLGLALIAANHTVGLNMFARKAISKDNT